MNKPFPRILFLSIIIGSCALSAAHAQSSCLTPELEQALTVQRDAGGFPLYAVPEVSEDQINHIRYMLERLLIRDDKKDGKIRQSLKDANVVFLMFEDGEDSEEFEYQMENDMIGCMPIPILGIEVHYLGSMAEQHGMVDESFSDITETIYYFGIKKAYPGWVSRLERAQRSAYADGRFNPHVAIDPDPRSLWDIEYLVIGLEVYYGFWKDKEQVRNGEFNYKTREEMQELDPTLFELIEEIFPSAMYL